MGGSGGQGGGRGRGDWSMTQMCKTRRELWVLGKQKQEEGEERRWRTR